MKLHLPKMLLTAVLAAIVAPSAWAETYDLLESNTSWAFTGRNPRPAYNADARTITTTEENWKQNLATYTMADARRNFEAVNSFAATITMTGNNGVLTLGFTGSNQTFVLGDFAYDTATLGYGTTTNTTSYVYHNGTPWDAGSTAGIDPVTSLDVNYAAGTYELVGTVTYTDGNYMLSMTINDTEYITSYNLGSTFDINRITFGYDGTDTATLSKLTITGEMGYVDGYYATTLAEGITNAAAATWTNGSTSVNYADIAMTDGSAILDFTGAAAGSTAVMDAGTNVNAIDISGGSVTLQAAEGGITTSELVVKDNATLKVGSDMTVSSVFSLGSNAAVSVANNSTLDLTGTDSQLVISDSTDEFSVLNNKITTEDGSFVKIAFNHSSSAELKLGSNLTLQPNVEAVGALVIHGKGGGNQFIIGEGKTLIAKGSSNDLSGLEAINKAVITINGGTVETTKLTLGHTSADADYWGKLDMTAGSLKLDNITLRHNHTNVFSVTGGELEFTSATALTRGTNTASTITIKGADADNTVTLKALTAGWTLDGAGLATAPTVGNVTIDASNTQMITLANVVLDGDIQNNATAEGAGLTLSGAITVQGSTSITETEMTENGYGTISTNVVIGNFKGDGNYVFADGLTFNGIAVSDYTRDGNTFTYSTGEQTSTVYQVVSADHTVDGSETNAAVDATGYKVYSGRTLTIAANQSETMTAAKILAEATGEGNALVTTDVTLVGGTTTQLTGALSVDGGSIKVSTDGTHDDIKVTKTDLSSFSSVSLNNASIEYLGATTTLKNVTVGKDGASLKFRDMAEVGSEFQLTGTTKLDGALTIGKMDGQAWKYSVHVAALTGNGDISITSADEAANLVIDALTDYAGTISVIKGSWGAATLRLNASKDQTIKGLSLKNATATILNQSGARATTISSLSVTGSATIETLRDPNCYNGTINIGALTSTGDSAELTLRNGSKTTDTTNFNLNGADGQTAGTFTGTIKLEGNAAGNSTRPVQLNLNHAVVAEKAVISFQDASYDATSAANDKHSQYNQMKLNLGVGKATVAGVSGESTKPAIIQSGEGTRTLHIAATDSYTTNAAVSNSVNLEKSGSGTQNFSGDMSAFNGTVEVSGGTLGFTKADGSVTVSSLTLSGGTLNVTNSLTLNNVIIDLTQYTAGVNIDDLVAAGNLISGENYSVSYAGGVTTVGNYTGTVEKIDNSLVLTWSDLTPEKTSLTTTISGVNGLFDSENNMLTLNIDENDSLANVGDVTISGISNDIMKDILGLTDLPTDGMVGITLRDKDGVEFAATADQMIGFQGNGGIYYGQKVENVGWVYQVAYIPEPATATLSLLALAGLAARRRRKH